MEEIQKKRVGAGVGIMILKYNKVLLGKRHDDPEKADSELSGEGTWTMPGGKMDFGDEIQGAAKREVFEETGIIIKNPKMISINNDKTHKAHFITMGFLVTDFEGIPEVKEPDEITEWKWFDLNHLPSPLFLPSAKILENYKKSQQTTSNNQNNITLNQYQKKCKRTNKVFNPPEMEILAWGLGISGEAGDVAGCIKKTYITKDNQLQGIKENLGDTMWYIAMICNYYNWDLNDVLQENINKLEKRYPKGFTYENAQKEKRRDWNEN